MSIAGFLTQVTNPVHGSHARPCHCHCHVMSILHRTASYSIQKQIDSSAAPGKI
jgi:hypothetical protein